MRTQPQNLIKQLASQPSRLTKESIIKNAAHDWIDEFFEGLRMALDPLVTFGVKQVPEREGFVGQGLSWEVFKELANKLSNRELTGHAARDAINLTMSIATTDQWNNWYRLILIKDMRCGISEKTINKALKEYPQYQIPVFGCQLAHDGANHEKKITGKKIIEVKLDGVRVITVVKPNGDVQMFSRNGKPLNNFPKITEWFSTKVAPNQATAMVFDGEVMSSSFQDLMKQVHRKDNVETDDAVLYLFDTLTLDEFASGESTIPQNVRSQELINISDFFHSDIIRVVEQELIDLDTDSGKDRLKQINIDAIEGGYEGIMIKDPEAPYHCKRSHAWLKMKPFIEVTLEVTNVEEGTGKNVGKLGALVCEGLDDGKQIRVNVGSGFTDSQRDTIWGDGNGFSVLGQLVEVRADAITQNQDGTYSLRFPRFKTFRGFETGEKL